MNRFGNPAIFSVSEDPWLSVPSSRMVWQYLADISLTLNIISKYHANYGQECNIIFALSDNGEGKGLKKNYQQMVSALKIPLKH